MLKKIWRLRHSEERKIFLNLWFQDRTFDQLSQKMGRPDEGLSGLLRSMQAAELVDIAQTEPEVFWQVHPDLRKKISKNMLRTLVTISLSLLGTAIAFGDRKLLQHQSLRMRRRVRSVEK